MFDGHSVHDYVHSVKADFNKLWSSTEAVERAGCMKGAAALGGDWKAVEDATTAEKASFKFFKVVVELT